MATRAQLEAQLEMVSLEEELARLKKLKNPDKKKLRDTKDALRKARSVYRTEHTDGVRPDAIRATSKVEK